MSSQVLNDRTFAPEAVQAMTAGQEATATMSVTGTVIKALLFLVLTVAFAAVGWNAAAKVIVQNGFWFFLGYMALIALTFAAVANPRIAAVAGLLYSLLMGLWMGAISRVYDSYYDGIVAQALFASLAIFFACLVLYLVKAVRVTSRFVQVVVSATFAVFLLYLFSGLLSVFGHTPRFWSSASPWGIGISLLIIIVAAANLFIEFAVIDKGVEAGAPKDYEWYSAFGLLTTLVWLYLEVLYLLARLRG